MIVLIFRSLDQNLYLHHDNLSKEHEGLSPQLVSLITDEPTDVNSVYNWRLLPSCPAHHLLHMMEYAPRPCFRHVQSPCSLNPWCLCHWLWALSSANIVTTGRKAAAQQESISSIWCNRDIILQMMRQRFLMSKSECSDHREIWKQISTFSKEVDYRQFDLQTGKKSRVALQCPDTQQSYKPGRPDW